MTASSIHSRTKWAVLSVVLAASVASANESAADEQAKALYKNGLRAYEAGEFDKALEQYTEAYQLSPRPGFLFNIGQCHRLMGHHEQAAFFYGRYIDNAKPNDKDVELARELYGEMIARAEAEKPKEARAAANGTDAPRRTDLVPTSKGFGKSSSPATQVSTGSTPVYQKPVFWISTGVIVTALAAGVVAGAVASSSGTVQPNTPTTLQQIDARKGK